LLFLVRAFFGDTITVAVWTGFHVCASWEADERPRHVGGAQYAYAYITLGRPSVEILSINGIRVCSKLTIFQTSQMQACRTAHGKAANVRFGSKADMTPFKRDVRFTPDSGHWTALSRA
jgi:hypothetical protein